LLTESTARLALQQFGDGKSSFDRTDATALGVQLARHLEEHSGMVIQDSSSIEGHEMLI
jgi:hypothetical protein